MLRVTAAAAICCISAALAQAQEPSGHAVAVNPDASAFGSHGARLLLSQDAVFMGDRLQTGAKGEAQLQFIDETRLVVGPNASLTIDSFIVKEKSVQQFALSAAKGTFRFFSGNSAKSAYSITTPTAILGVRGTQFDFTVLPDGETEFVLIHGEVTICDKFGNCIVAGRPCTLVSVPVRGPPRLLPTYQRSKQLQEHFPYVVSQEARLEKAFQTDVSRCGVYAQGAYGAFSSNVGETTPGRPLDGVGGGMGGGAPDFSGFNVLFPSGVTAPAPSANRRTQTASLLGAGPLFVPIASDPLSDPVVLPRPDPLSGPVVLPIPGPVAGAGLPTLATVLGLVWWRRRRKAAPNKPAGQPQ